MPETCCLPVQARAAAAATVPTSFGTSFGAQPQSRVPHHRQGGSACPAGPPPQLSSRVGAEQNSRPQGRPRCSPLSSKTRAPRWPAPPAACTAQAPSPRISQQATHRDSQGPALPQTVCPQALRCSPTDSLQYFTQLTHQDATPPHPTGTRFLRTPPLPPPHLAKLTASSGSSLTAGRPPRHPAQTGTTPSCWISASLGTASIRLLMISVSTSAAAPCTARGSTGCSSVQLGQAAIRQSMDWSAGPAAPIARSFLRHGRPTLCGLRPVGTLAAAMLLLIRSTTGKQAGPARAWHAG